MTATDGDKDRPQNIVYFLTGQGIDPDNPANSKFDINRTTGEIFVLKVSTSLWCRANDNRALYVRCRLFTLDTTRACVCVCVFHHVNVVDK